MGLTVCPAAVVTAPVEVIWENLVQWERYSKWFSADVHVERSEPEGPATVGQTISFGGKAFGRTWHFIFPPGWWGWFLETFGAKSIAASVEHGLQNLKRTSERQYQHAQTEGK